jgi:hypothetical protein
MHFGTKSYLKSNRNHTAKQTLTRVKINDRRLCELMFNLPVLLCMGQEASSKPWERALWSWILH